MTGATAAAAPPEVADLVRAAVFAVPGVVDLHSGQFGEVATLLPGRRVAGVRLAAPGDANPVTEVSVVVVSTTPVPVTAAAVHAALVPLVAGPVHVVVSDVLTPDEQMDRSTDQASHPA